MCSSKHIIIVVLLMRKSQPGTSMPPDFPNNQLHKQLTQVCLNVTDLLSEQALE